MGRTPISELHIFSWQSGEKKLCTLPPLLPPQSQWLSRKENVVSLSDVSHTDLPQVGNRQLQVSPLPGPSQGRDEEHAPVATASPGPLHPGSLSPLLLCSQPLTSRPLPHVHRPSYSSSQFMQGFQISAPLSSHQYAELRRACAKTPADRPTSCQTTWRGAVLNLI